MTSSAIPDVNVWLALAYDRHVHHPLAVRWLAAVPAGARVVFCRLTQMGLLRLVTNPAVMEPGRVCSQSQAWSVFDKFLADDRIRFEREPDNLERVFRSFTASPRPAGKEWSDSYLAAFSQVSGLRLVTFDRSLADRAPHALWLRDGMVN